MVESYFAQRVEPIEEVLAQWGVSVPAAGELAVADEQVENQLEQLGTAAGVEQTQDAALTLLGQRWVSGELKASTVVDRISSAANSPRGAPPSRLGVVLEGARVALRHELDRPEWSPKALRQSCVPAAQKVLDAVAVELVESWQGLPGWLQDRVRAERVPRIANVMKYVEVTTVSGKDLEGARRAAAVWGRWFDGRPPVPSDPMVFLGLGRELRRGNTWSWHDDGEDGPDWPVCWTDHAREVGAGYRIEVLVMAGMVDTLCPLADPLGSQADEYQERLAVADGVREWRNYQGRMLHNMVEAGVPLSGATREKYRHCEVLRPAQVLVEMQDSEVLQ